MTDPAPSGSPAAQPGCANERCPANSETPRGREKQIYRHAAHTLRKEARRYDLRHLEDQVLQLIIDISLGLGERSVKIPKLDVIVDFTGISRANVSRTIHSLHTMGILLVELKEGIPVYTVNANTAIWRCRIKVPKDQARRAMDIVKAFNGMEGGDTSLLGSLHALETPSNFHQLPDAGSLGASVVDSATVIMAATETPLPFLE